MCAVLSTKGKWLARGTTRYKLNPILVGSEINSPHVTLRDVPSGHGSDAARFVFADRVAAIAVPLDNIDWVKACLMQTYPKPSRSSE
jgi:hypothetical protein